MRFLNVMVMLCLFVVIGCAEFKDAKKQGKYQENLRVNAQNLSDFVKVDVQPTTEPEKYMIYFGWPKLTDSRQVRIRMEQALAVVDVNQTTFSHEVSHNQILTYTFDVLTSDSKIEKSFSRQVKVPQDFVVRSGQSSISEDSHITVNRFFLSKDTPFKTNGFNLELVTNELHSTDGIIETFSENTKAPNNTNGKSGGIIKINTKLATGDLKIFMRGQHGGDGAKGEVYTSRAMDGSPAGEGVKFCDCVGKNCLVAANNNFEILGDLQPSGTVCTCESKGSDGGRGADGLQGRKGHSAGNGGSAGELKVSIQDGREFDLKTYAVRGIAGTPGEGGEGQDGGVGGQKPDTTTGRKCGGNAGLNGSKGPRGERGEIGLDGNDGLLCVYIASEGKNDCY